jgi:hypothetical protein
MKAYVLKAPAQSFTPPAWATMHNAEQAAIVLVIILLAFAVLRLAKGGKAVPALPPAPKKSGRGKVLLLAGLGGAGFWYWDTHLRHAPAGAVKAAPVPSPSPVPTPRPTVTQTVAPHVTLPAHFPLTGTQILIGLAVVVIGSWLITRVVVRNVP